MSRKMSQIMLLCSTCLILSLLVNSGQASDFKNLGDIAETIGNLLGSSTDCKFQCPSGGTPKDNPAHRPDADGCGSYGFKLDVSSMPGMTTCCDIHDYCYDGCNNDKQTCDKELKHCLQRVCYKLEDQKRERRGQTWRYDPKDEGALDCNSLVQMIYGGVSALGCDAYLTAQKSACTCPAPNSKRGYGSRHSRERYLHNDL